MGEKINSSISELKFDDAKETIDRLRYYGLNKVSFTLTEPFLNTDLFKVIDYCTKQGIHVNVLTNGTVLGVKAKTVLNSNIDSIGITLPVASLTRTLLAGLQLANIYMNTGICLLSVLQAVARFTWRAPWVWRLVSSISIPNMSDFLICLLTWKWHGQMATTKKLLLSMPILLS